MEEQCRATKANGERCREAATPPNGYCWAHDPTNGEKRQKAASRGGKAKVGKVAKELHELLENLTERVVDGELETSRGAVANQLIGSRIRLLEYERRLRETEELETRLEALEAASDVRGYGAGRRG